MANRAYLFALDFDPSQRARTAEDKIASIGEWNYGVPISFQLLLSGEPRMVPSQLWEDECPIAILADFPSGMERLNRFLDDLRRAEYYDAQYLQTCLEETRAFFARCPRYKYFLLECGELYDMEDRPIELQNREMVESLRHPEENLAAFFRNIREDLEQKPWYMGLDNWSAVL